MTQKKFMETLATLPSKGWRVKIQKYGRIRLAAPGKKTFTHCPATAVCLDVTGRGHNINSVLPVSTDLDITPSLICDIADAADSSECALPKLKVAMYKALGLNRLDYSKTI